MQPYQEQVISEQLELMARIVALGNFFESSSFKNSDLEEKNRIRKQYFYMASYSGVLAERIGRFNADEKVKEPGYEGASLRAIAKLPA